MRTLVRPKKPIRSGSLARFLAPVFGLAFALLPPPPLSAQVVQRDTGPSVAPAAVGEELLVRYLMSPSGPSALRASNTVKVELVSANEEHLVGRSRGRLLVIDTRSIRSVRRQIGTKPASAPAMVLGSAAGFAGGFLVGATAHTSGAQSRRGAMDDGLVTGVLVGAPLGALVAWLASRSRPIYEDVGIGHVHPAVAVNPSGQVGLSIEVVTR